jgi:hypothetical protein
VIYRFGCGADFRIHFKRTKKKLHFATVRPTEATLCGKILNFLETARSGTHFFFNFSLQKYINVSYSKYFSVYEEKITIIIFLFFASVLALLLDKRRKIY